jgi:hypothetical protein
MFEFMWGYVMGQRSAAQASAFARTVGAAEAASNRTEMNGLDERIDRLLLLVQAMWALLEEAGYSDEALAAKLTELDEADGVADGRHTEKPATCRKCGSKVAVGLAACQFCGEPLPREPDPFAGT